MKIQSFLSYVSCKDIFSNQNLFPFFSNDITAGSENELQTAVIGKRENVDLPLTIESSNYYANILKRAISGEMENKDVTSLEMFLRDNPLQTWENSWVRFPIQCLCGFSKEILEHDLLKDKNNPSSGKRQDMKKFLFSEKGRELLRVPVSYLIKLALADAMGTQGLLPEPLSEAGCKLMNHILSDNISPETYSFYVTASHNGKDIGFELAKETGLRFLLVQFLTAYANKKFQLLETGQRVIVYFSPQPPIKARELNDLISDSFYSDLFISPCLSGWDRGEEKYQYMHLCHQVLSRSQLNCIPKLKEAGIITNNLVVLPNTSHVCLANNGTHVSLGSRCLSAMLSENHPAFTHAHEKYCGDLAIKITEHFLPLFVGTYTAAPYRFDFSDFHPEKTLGFLPHELDYTHLRMIWRRWKRKARNQIMGRSITPFGPKWLDTLLSRLFFLKGDLVNDFRLLDYFVSLMSTDQNPALDGSMGNLGRLKKDLSEMGIFDERMAPYLLYRLREFRYSGFTGFEARYYSLFENFKQDMAQAVNLQAFFTALSYKYILSSQVTHEHIPDDPTMESERRQIFFGRAIGIPTFFVLKETKNQFLKKILEKTKKVRASRRYPGYLRVYHKEYLNALLRLIQEDGRELIEMFGLSNTIKGLEERINAPNESSAAGELIKGIMSKSGGKTSPMTIKAREFNLMAENYYRNSLREKHMEEAFFFLEEALVDLHKNTCLSHDLMQASSFAIGEMDISSYLSRCKKEFIQGEELPLEQLTRLINLTILAVRHEALIMDQHIKNNDAYYETSVS